MSLRYVILWHDGVAEPHFDLMFETLLGSPLATWRSPIWPIEKPTEVARLKDHRREYLDYEGELTERRGSVTRIATGTCSVEIGEAAIWTIRLLTGASPALLVLRADPAGVWQAIPGPVRKVRYVDNSAAKE